MRPHETGAELTFKHERKWRTSNTSDAEVLPPGGEQAYRRTTGVIDIRLELVLPLRNPLQFLGKDTMPKMVGLP